MQLSTCFGLHRDGFESHLPTPSELFLQKKKKKFNQNQTKPLDLISIFYEIQGIKEQVNYHEETMRKTQRVGHSTEQLT